MKPTKMLCAAFTVLFLFAFGGSTAFAASSPQEMISYQTLPGYEQARPYLEQSPVSLQEFLSEGWASLRPLLPCQPLEALRQEAAIYADVLLFLLLVLFAGLLVGEEGEALLDMAAAGSCSLLIWQDILLLAETLSSRIEHWRDFVMGFLPLYAGILAAGGEAAASASVRGFFLTALCGLAQIVSVFAVPLTRLTLALCLTCGLCDREGAGTVCKGCGSLLRQGIGLAGKLFAALLGLQRLFTAGADRAALRAGQILSSSVPIIGQTLSSVTEAVLAGMQLFKGALGFAAAAILTAEFLPFYLRLLAHVGMLSLCSLFCGALSIQRCKVIFDGVGQAVQVMAAITALYFGMILFGTALFFLPG